MSQSGVRNAVRIAVEKCSVYTLFDWTAILNATRQARREFDFYILIGFVVSTSWFSTRSRVPIVRRKRCCSAFDTGLNLLPHLICLNIASICCLVYPRCVENAVATIDRLLRIGSQLVSYPFQISKAKGSS